MEGGSNPIPSLKVRSIARRRLGCRPDQSFTVERALARPHEVPRVGLLETGIAGLGEAGRGTGGFCTMGVAWPQCLPPTVRKPMPLGIPRSHNEMRFLKLPVMLCAKREQVSLITPPHVTHLRVALARAPVAVDD